MSSEADEMDGIPVINLRDTSRLHTDLADSAHVIGVWMLAADCSDGGVIYTGIAYRDPTIADAPVMDYRFWYSTTNSGRGFRWSCDGDDAQILRHGDVVAAKLALHGYRKLVRCDVRGDVNALVKALEQSGPFGLAVAADLGLVEPPSLPNVLRAVRGKA